MVNKQSVYKAIRTATLATLDNISGYGTTISGLVSKWKQSKVNTFKITALVNELLDDEMIRIKKGSGKRNDPFVYVVVI